MRSAPLSASHPLSTSLFVGDTTHLSDTSTQADRPLHYYDSSQWLSLAYPSKLLLAGLTELEDIFDIESTIGSGPNHETKQSTGRSWLALSAWQGEVMRLASDQPTAGKRSEVVSSLVPKPITKVSRWTLSEPSILTGLLLNCLMWCTILFFGARQGESSNDAPYTAGRTAIINWPDSALRPPDHHH